MEENRQAAFGFFGPGYEWIWLIIIVFLFIIIFCPGIFGGCGYGYKD